MKSIFALLAFMLLSLAAQAQVYPITSDIANKTPAQAAKDTVVNATTKTQTIKVQKSYSAAAIYAKVTKISGTTAGYVRIFVSDDGVNFVRLGGADSSLIANVAGVQSKRFIVSGTPDRFYRVSYTGVGTMSAEIVSNLIAKP